MGKSKSLPDSLELLLDTMCNTFGGIMFIAISLIIISSMVAKTITECLPERIDEAAIKKMEDVAAEFRKRIKELQNEENELIRNQLKNVSPERLKVMKDIADLKRKNDELKKQRNDLEFQRKMMQKSNSEKESELKQRETKNQSDEAKTKDQEKKLRAQLEEQKERTEKIRREYDAYVPKHLTFSMEESTLKEPYFIGLTEGRLFHIGTNRSRNTDEIIEERNSIQKTVTFKLRPGKGIPVGRGGNHIFDTFFENISPERYFIFFSVGNGSFTEFRETRKYLREKGYQVYWEYNPDFQFSVTEGGTSYKASQ